jgi:ArsR family transcriptional regulator, virulence genes transcriptional regulator
MQNQTRAKAEEDLYELQAEFCKGMAHPKRIYILSLLKDGEKTVNEISRLTGIPQANVSQHLAILRKLEIVLTRREGSSVFYSISDHRVVEACELVRGSIGERLRRTRLVLQVTR